ncbi:MAG: hypothetical protein KBS96_04515 [Lachnospiraceae bacterium]|nr:hypothetical protein [Candidatus Colinaster scatohippi]
MAEIRNFPKGEPREKTENFNSKIVRHRLRTTIRGLIVLAIIAVIALLLVRQYREQSYANLVISARGEKESLSDNYYLNNNGSVITYSKDGISSTDGTGKVLWNMTYEMQRPMVRQATGVVAVADYNGHIVYMIDSSGKQFEIDTNLPIKDFAVSSEERVAAVLEDSANTWVNLYDLSGSKLVEIKATMSKTGYPIAVTLTGEVMGVSYFYVDGENMRNSVTFYNFGGIGENTPDHIVSSYDYVNAVVPVLKYIDEETIVAVADNRLMFYSGSKKPVSVSDVLLNENIVGTYYGDGNMGLLFYDITGEKKYRLDLYEKTGKLCMSYAFDMDFKDILIHNGQVMIYNESNCILISSDGKEKFTGQFEDSVLYLSNTTSNKKYIAVTKDAIETLTFE